MIAIQFVVWHELPAGDEPCLVKLPIAGLGCFPERS
jgi:hypothetical protein